MPRAISVPVVSKRGGIVHAVAAARGPGGTTFVGVGTTIPMATTDEKCLTSGPVQDPDAPSEGPPGERRQRAREILQTQRSRLDRLESDLNDQLRQLAEELGESVRLSSSAASGEESAALVALQAQFETLKRQFDALDAEGESQRRQLEEALLERGRSEQELRIREALLKEAQGRDEESRLELAAQRERLADCEAQLAATRERHAALERELAEARDATAAEREETKAQRRRIAREFKQQRAEHLAELEKRKAELQALVHPQSGPGNEQAQRELAELRESVERRRTQIEEARREIERLGTENAELRGGLERAKTGGGDSQEAADLKRRFELAIDELREMKRANSELEAKLKTHGTAVPAVSGGMDWEAQKQRLLASLEADQDDDEEAVAERTSVEGTIRITDQIVAQKDREIAELKTLLEERGTARGESAAVAELVDRDEIICQEREKLQQIQAEWREKIGQAEIEISLQRAKIARERTELDEKLRQLELENQRQEVAKEPAEPGKPARGRWLARLGLKDLEDKENK
jgi:chromosome segregation ATPase